MIKKLSSFTTTQKLGVALVFLLVVVILILQIMLLIEGILPTFTLVTFPILGYFSYAYVTFMYLGISILIGVEAKNLEEFHIDKFTIMTFVLGSILRRRIGAPAESFFLILIALSGILAIFMVARKKPTLPRTNMKWVFVGIGIGCGTVIIITFLELLFRGTWVAMPLFRNNLIATVIGEIVKEFSFGALVEEILFRGFLWGYLKKEGWNENKVIWTQGILFWVLHLSRIVTPFTFFIVIPLITMIFSKLTLRSRQLFPAIVAHIIINVISSLLNLSTY